LADKITVLLLLEGFYDANEFTGSEQIVSQTFPELALTTEQVLQAGTIAL
jgi:Uma2 family endonuclease